MPEYAFDNISPLDFELLVRDLLQEELGERFESFCSGADEGVDLRHVKSGSNLIIVQCKHYANTPWDGLLRSYRSERGKIAVLNPQRYIAATSQRLTPSRKDSIIDAVRPYCKHPQDVLGREDLNNLLSRHPQVERAHFKLWLSSVPVLQKVLHSGIFSEQTSLLASLRRRISRYVMNPSFERAQSMLSRTGFCLVTGVPGIGKTTLAEMLVLDYTEQGYECFRLSESVSEARDVFSPNEPQLFYFDDFLGRTGLRAPAHRNEDTRLLSFIGDVLESHQTKFILTTREYILNQAVSFMEALASADLDSARCVVAMGDYTPRIRAEILYNHLYYSSLPREYLELVVETGVYRDIVRHRNYSPRIVDAMTQSLRAKEVSPAEYPKAFLANLDQPDRIWRTAYEEHIGCAGQNLLLVLCSLPERVFIDNLGEAFDRFHRYRREKYGHPGTAYDFSKALKDLGGSFISTELFPSSLVVELLNPSIRDFLESWLEEHPADLEDLAHMCAFNEQAERLWRLAESWGGGTAARSVIAVLAESFVATANTAGVALHAYRNDQNEVADWRPTRVSPIMRLNRAVRLAKEAAPELGKSVVAGLLPGVLDALEQGYTGNLDELCLLLEGILAGRVPGVDEKSPLYGAALKTAFEEQIYGREADEYVALAELLEEFPGIVGEEALDGVKSAFLCACEDDLEMTSDQGSSDDRASWYSEWEAAADALGMWVPGDESEYVGNDEDEPPAPRPSAIAGIRAGTDGIGDRELDSMFGSLCEADHTTPASPSAA
jgi:hypothetical protein